MKSRIDTESPKAQRIAGGGSQEELARVSGPSARTIQRVEAGAHASLETGRALAAIFDTTVGEWIRSPVSVALPISGARWGIVSALLGYACAIAAVRYALYAGQTSGWNAGVTLGVLGAATGALCGAIGWSSMRGERCFLSRHRGSRRVATE